MRLRPTWAEVDLGALRENFKWLKSLNPGAFFCPMVKANAYGHGDVLVATEVERLGADAVGVALIEEGLRLREAGVRLPILVFASFEADAAEHLVAHALTPVLGRREDVLALRGVPAGFPVHLKFNTGMQRLGFDPGDLDWLRQTLTNARLRVTGTCTQLSHGEDGADPAGPSARQIETFLHLTEGFPGVRHANKSASLITRPKPDAEDADGSSAPSRIGARPGAGLFGIPFSSEPLAPELKPVLSLKTHVTHFHRISKGQTVSYGATWRAERDSVIGVVPMGYADGYLRALSGRGQMIWRGAKIPVVGHVCMDYTMLDLTDAILRHGQPLPGEAVTVLGPGMPADEIARLAKTIAYEIVTGLSPRVPREAI